MWKKTPFEDKIVGILNVNNCFILDENIDVEH
jgi:hypothetical protein